MNRQTIKRVVGSALCCLVLTSVGCGDSFTSPTPVASAMPVTPSGIAGMFSLTGSPGVVAAGGELTVRFEAPAGRGCNGGGDWIAIYRVGDPDQTGARNGHSDLWYDHVCGATSGTWKLAAPMQPGIYEFRFMVGDGAVARSNPIAVTVPEM